MAKAQIIPASQELRRKAVNFQKGIDVALDEEAIAQLETIISKSSDTFLTEITKNLAVLRASLQQARSDSDDHRSLIEDIEEASYHIKALGGTFDFALLTQIAKSLNDFVTDRRTATAKQWDVMRLHVDVMHLVLAQKLTGMGSKVERATVAALMALGRRFREPRGVPAPAPEGTAE